MVRLTRRWSASALVALVVLSTRSFAAHSPAAGPAAPSAITFQPPRVFPTGVNPYGVAIGDVNGDGKADLVIADGGSDSITVLIGNGQDGFTSRVDIPVGALPYAVALADLDGDGKLDAVVANSDSNSVSVLLGNNTATFGPRTQYATGRSPRAVAIADLNGDHRLDIAVANLNSSTISVLSGDGAGGFGVRTDYATGAVPYAIAIGDLNADAHPDIVTANYGSYTISVLISNGAGGFSAHTDIPAGTAPYGVALGSLDVDGTLDVAVSDAGSNLVTKMSGDGTGGFVLPSTFQVGAGPRQIAAADMNGDGLLDLVVADYSASTVTVLTNNGAGGFVRADLTGAANPRGVAVGDLNADGRPDMAVTNVGSNSVTVWLSGTGSVASSTTALVSDINPSTFGQQVTFTATVSPSTGGTTTGTVTFLNGLASLGTITVGSNGSAVLRTTTLSPGVHRMTAVFSGNAVTAASISDSLLQRVVSGSVTTLTAGQNPTLLGDAVLLTATVFALPPASGTPTGSVTFRQGTDTLGAAPLIAGAATLQVPGFSAGTHALTAAYGGDSTFLPSTSSNYSLIVLVPTATALTSSANPSPYGAVLRLTATVTPADTSAGLPAGSVTFKDGLSTLGSATLSGGSAVFTTSTMSVGLHSLTAVFGASPPFAGSTSPALVEAISAVPGVVSVRDVPADQGREVRLVVRRSPLDIPNSPSAIVRYEVFRRIEQAVARMSGAIAADVRRGTRPSGPVGATLDGWDAVGTMGAYTDSLYNIVVATLADSNATGSHFATYFVRAATATPSVYYDSAPDSGYSVDDLAPAAPVGLTVAAGGGVTRLSWSANREPDLSHYDVYRGLTAEFVAGPATRIASITDTSYVDASASGVHYKLAAVDVNGNSSAFASGDAPVVEVPRTLVLERVRPNPVLGGALEVRFGLPAAGPATLELLDVAGRRIALVDAGALGAGWHVVRLGDGTRIRPGFYVLRLRQQASVRVTRVEVIG